jgi:class 3 adenylate cyclase
MTTGGIITAMFTDIVDSTRLKSVMPVGTVLGRDLAYQETAKKPHDLLVFACVRTAGGRVVESVGDGHLFTFDDAEQAVLCGLEILESLRARPIATPLGPLQLRIGIHTGMAARPRMAGSALFDKAARVQASAEPGQLLVSHETHALVATLRDVHFEATPPIELKGLGAQVLFRAYRSAPARAESPVVARESAHLAGLDNPYDFATTASHETFKGRAHEMEELLASIESGTHTAVFGLQRMGKTSLIEQGLMFELQGRPALRNSLLVAKVDMQRLGGAQVTYKDFVHGIFEAVVEQLNTHALGRDVPNLRNLTRDLLTANRYQRGDRTEFFSTFARVLGKLAAESRRRFIVLIDEFSEIRKVIESNRETLHRNPARTMNLLPHDMYIDVPFIHHLGSLLKDPALKRQITFIVVVRPFIAEYDEREGLQLLKLMKPITLRHLDESAAKELITGPLDSYVSYEQGAVDYLYRLTAGHPYLLQFMLKLIVDRLKRENRAEITVADIKWLEERMIAEGPAYDAQFSVLISDYSVDEVTHRHEARLGEGLLALVAKLCQQHGGWATADDIYEAMSRQKIPEEKTESLLSQLTRTRILEEDSAGDELRFRLSIPLVQERFVKQNLYRKYFRKG